MKDQLKDSCCPACGTVCQSSSGDGECGVCGTWMSWGRRNFEYTSQYSEERDHEHPAVREQKARTLRHWLEKLPQPLQKNSKVLEWGFGGGGTLQVLQKENHHVFGVEATDEHLAVAEALGIPRERLARGFAPWLGRKLDQSGASSGIEDASVTFDLILYLDSFEHLLDPRQHLAELNELTRPGSQALVVLPRADCVSRKVMGKAWPHDLPDHWIFYSQKGLESLWASFGWVPVKRFHPSKCLSPRTIQKHLNWKFPWLPTGPLGLLPNLWFNFGELGLVLERKSS